VARPVIWRGQLYADGITGAQHVQPVDFPVMGEFEDELVDHAVNSNCSTDEFEVGVG
jgi:hypothetical protein